MTYIINYWKLTICFYTSLILFLAKTFLLFLAISLIVYWRAFHVTRYRFVSSQYRWDCFKADIFVTMYVTFFVIGPYSQRSQRRKRNTLESLIRLLLTVSIRSNGWPKNFIHLRRKRVTPAPRPLPLNAEKWQFVNLSTTLLQAKGKRITTGISRETKREETNEEVEMRKDDINLREWIKIWALGFGCRSQSLVSKAINMC